MNWLIPSLVAYALGSVPFGLLLTRIGGTEDLRSIGSGNIGATNVLRTGRKGLAAATLLLDLFKGLVAVLLAAHFFPGSEGLAALAWEPATGASSRMLASAGDAQFSLDGIAMTSSSNTIANAAPGSISIARFRSNRWYVGANSRDTGNSLWVSRLGGAGQEVADGVQSMTLAFHRTAGGTATTYEAAPSDYQYVNAVRVSMPVRGVSQSKSSENRNINRAMAATVSIRNRSL